MSFVFQFIDQPRVSCATRLMCGDWKQHAHAGEVDLSLKFIGFTRSTSRRQENSHKRRRMQNEIGF